MPFADLFWACPVCGRRDSIRAGKGTAACAACGAAWRRGSGADVIQRTTNGVETRLHARELLDGLLRLDPLAEGPPPPARVRMAEALPARPVRRRGELLGWAERFGPGREGTLRLEDEALVFTGDDGSVTTLALDQLTGLQPSSRSLQLKMAGRPVLSFRLLEGSVYDWERRIQAALRRSYASRGAEIAEFQPRVCISRRP